MRTLKYIAARGALALDEFGLEWRVCLQLTRYRPVCNAMTTIERQMGRTSLSTPERICDSHPEGPWRPMFGTPSTRASGVLAVG